MDDQDSDDSFDEPMPNDTSHDDSDTSQEDLAPENRVTFNPNDVDNHFYIFSGAEIETRNVTMFPEGSQLTLKSIPSKIVVFPGRSIPVMARCPYSKKLYKELYEKGDVAVASISGNPLDLNVSFNPFYGTLVKITKFEEQNLGGGNSAISLEFTATQRCHITAKNRSNYSVTVLGETLLPPISSLVLPHCALTGSNQKKIRQSSSMTQYPEFLTKDLTSMKCEELIQHFSHWFSEKHVRNIKELLGETAFSFWVCSNSIATPDESYQMLRESNTNKRIDMLYNISKRKQLLVCTNCKETLCPVDSLIKMNKDSLSEHYVNPSGYVHNLLTVSTLSNFIKNGEPSSEFSWFPGYKWQILQCSNCYEHIGWEFTSKTLNPEKFYGLTSCAIEQMFDLRYYDDPEDDLIVA